MGETEWHETVDLVTPHVVRISTPEGSGTGFLVSATKSTQLCAIATAAHVVSHSHYWEEPIRIEHQASGKTRLLKVGDRAILIDDAKDTAAVLFERRDLPLPPEPLALSDRDKHFKAGVEIGWLGFPAIPRASLCFFSGRISAWVPTDDAYLVDGVAINGVSGGPAFALWGGMLAGVVSAYIPNRRSGEVLPGLAVVRGVSQFHDVAMSLPTLDDAKSEQTPAIEPPPPADNEIQQKPRKS